MTDRKTILSSFPGYRGVVYLRNNLRAKWFDWRYGVKTQGDEDPRKLTVTGTNLQHALPYIPTTPRIGRHLLRQIPVEDVTNYTFIDMGSGKGRMLLLAAERPFLRIIGIEFSSELNQLAQSNLAAYRNQKQACRQIALLNIDATQFDYPPGPLLIYFFFPFDRAVMEPVIQNLNRSLVNDPRDAIVVYLNPVLGDVVEAATQLKLLATGTYRKSSYSIYRSLPVVRVGPGSPIGKSFATSGPASKV